MIESKSVETKGSPLLITDFVVSSPYFVNDMYLQLIYREVEKPRITIRKETVTIKLPRAYKECPLEILEHTRQAAKQYIKNNVEQTVRGRFHSVLLDGIEKWYINFSGTERAKLEKGKEKV